MKSIKILYGTNIYTFSASTLFIADIFSFLNTQICAMNLTKELTYFCFDLSDSSVCGDNYFRCDSGQCIHKSQRCNGQVTCTDSSDEEHCGIKF